MKIDNENIGYLVKNEESEDQERKIAVVKNNGENMGDYCCMRHAINAAIKAHYNLGDNHIVIDNDSTLDLLKHLLLASMLSDISHH
jgi:hypothetical protein